MFAHTDTPATVAGDAVSLVQAEPADSSVCSHLLPTIMFVPVYSLVLRERERSEHEDMRHDTDRLYICSGVHVCEKCCELVLTRHPTHAVVSI